MVETEQSLFTIGPDDHLALIGKYRSHRDQLRKLKADHFALRVKIAERMNEAEALVDDLLDAIPLSRDTAKLHADLRAAKDRRDRTRAEMATSLERGRALSAAVHKSEAELELAIGGVQTSLIEEIAHVEPERHETAASLRTARQRKTADAVVFALRAMGGRGSCVELARLIGVSSHGLGGLIDGDGRLRKTHDGRLQNQQTWYELTGEAR